MTSSRRRIPRLSGGARGERREEHARRARELRALPGGRSCELHRNASLMRGSGTGSCSCNAARRAADQGDTRSSQERHPSVGKKKKGARCVQRAPSERACGQRLVTLGFASGFLRRLRLSHQRFSLGLGARIVYRGRIVVSHTRRARAWQRYAHCGELLCAANSGACRKLATHSRIRVGIMVGSLPKL